MSNFEMLRSQQLERQLAGLTKLLETTCQLAAEQDLDRILQIVTTQACEALDCDRASLFLYDEHRQELYTRVVTELEIAEIRSPVSVGVTGWVARHRQIANIADPPLDPRWNPQFDRETGYRTENMLTAPLVSNLQERLIGVIQLLNKRGGNFDEFDEQIVSAFGMHAAIAVERASLVEELRRRQMLEASLALARDVQAGFLPSELPKPDGYEVAAWWQPAEGVGGDYFDVLPLADGRLGLAMADVSGHGVGPSLIMATARAMLHILTRTSSAPEHILQILSQTIAPDLQDGRFITFFLGALDTRHHKFSFANAGHGPAVYFEGSTEKFRPLESSGFPIGFCPDEPVGFGGSLTLRPGDLLVLATDGAVEQHDSQDRMFGSDRLREIIRRNHRLSAQELVDVLRQSLADFHDGSHPDDDITILIVKRLATKPR